MTLTMVLITSLVAIVSGGILGYYIGYGGSRQPITVGIFGLLLGGSIGLVSAVVTDLALWRFAVGAVFGLLGALAGNLLSWSAR